MRQITIFVLAIILLPSLIQAQYINTSPEAATTIQNSILLVGLAEEDPSVASLMDNNKTLLSSYKNEIEGKNQAIKKAIDSCWYFSKQVQFLPISKAKALMKKEKNKYVLMYFGEEWAPETWVNPNETSNAPKVFPGWILKNEKLTYDPSTRINVYNMRISTLEIGIPRKVFEVYLPTKYVSEGDMIFAIQHIQHSLSYLLEAPENNIPKYHREASKRADELQQKTLWIDKADIRDQNVISTIKDNYAFPVKFTSYLDIQSALQRKDTTVAVISIARFDNNNSIYSIINAGNGNLYFHKTYLTYMHGERLGEYGIRLTPFGITSGILNDIATSVK